MDTSDSIPTAVYHSLTVGSRRWIELQTAGKQPVHHPPDEALTVKLNDLTQVLGRQGLAKNSGPLLTVYTDHF